MIRLKELSMSYVTRGDGRRRPVYLDLYQCPACGAGFQAFRHIMQRPVNSRRTCGCDNAPATVVQARKPINVAWFNGRTKPAPAKQVLETFVLPKGAPCLPTY